MAWSKLNGSGTSVNNYVDKVILIVGPTGVGKTELAIRLAERINGEIISADSRYLYRGMNVGTAKPNSNDRNRVPHHLIDVANPDETWSLANFIDRTLLLIEEIHKRQRSVVIVGGSGQYFRALIEGWQIPELEANHLLRDCLGDWAEDISGIGLHHKLAIIDPQAAEKIDPTNIRRTIRGLEVIFSTGRRFSELRKRVEPMYRYHVIGLTMPRARGGNDRLWTGQGGADPS
mgnify:FL=1